VVLDFLVDYDLLIALQVGPFRSVGERDEPPDPKMRTYRRLINSPPDLPVFKDGEVEQHSGVVPVQIPFDVLSSGIIYLETSIQAPGFSATEQWIIEARMGQLRLKPPKNR
jgi:hypothetical protein